MAILDIREILRTSGVPADRIDGVMADFGASPVPMGTWSDAITAQMDFNLSIFELAVAVRLEDDTKVSDSISKIRETVERQSNLARKSIGDAVLGALARSGIMDINS